MNRFYKATFSLILMLSGLLASHRSYAEGSKDLYPNGVVGGRAFLVSTTGTKQPGWTLTNRGVHYAYLNAGETLGAASSAQGIGSGQIILTAPDGTVYSSTAGSTTVGQIANRTQEKQGPWVGYTPFSRVVGAGQAGLWKIELLSTNPPATIAEGVGANINADLDWTQSPNSSAIAAWDVSVRSAGGTIIPGRVYTNILNMYVDAGNYRGIIYVLTKDGYVYKVNNNGSSGIGFVAFVNNKGLTTNSTDAGAPLYKSVSGANMGTDFNTWDPRSDDGVYSVTHKMFYNIPATDMPATATMPGGKLTWLRSAKIIPTVTNISVDGVEGTSGQVSKKGAYIKFTASVGGTYRISLEGTGSFVTRKMTGTAVAGNNSVFWDGKDGANVSPSLGTAAVVAKIQLQGAEVHFPFIDVENNPNGLIIEQLNDDNTVKSDLVYWDDVSVGTGTGASNPRTNGNDGNGISSNTNGHKWSSNYGDVKAMDTWTYVLGDMAQQNTTLNIVVADLAIQNIAPAGGVTQVYAGRTITYNITAVNNGPSDVTGAPFAIKVPAGFTVADVSAITYNTSCGTVKNAAIDASGNYSALLDMPNGCVITFSITGTAGPSMAAGKINMEASIMRPKDVTDPDATNLDPAVQPTDPHLECKNGGTTETCNNINYNKNVTVLANADIVVAKQLQDPSKTTYSAGETVNYVFTVRNEGPNDAVNVQVTDAAPAGTSIIAWTASAAGTLALPHPNGVGNINETIALMKPGEEATYVVQVKLPVGYNSALKNTATASSTTLDATPANNTSTTPDITLEPGADIAVVKALKNAATSYVPGEDVVYTITVTNNGPGEAKDVNVKDDAPNGTMIKEWSATVVSGVVSALVPAGAGNIDQVITSMQNGAVVQYEVTVSVPADYKDPLTNTATATTTSRDDVPGNNTGTSSTLPPAPKADVSIVKTTSATSYVPGADVTYTIVVSNNGPSDAQSVRVQDAAPAGTTISAWTAVATNGIVTLPAVSGTGDLDQTIATLPAATGVTYTIVLSTNASRTTALANTATVSSPADYTPNNNTSTTTGINPAPKADVVLIKTTTATNYVPGQSVVYKITVENNGPSDATNVNVVDNAPAGTTISAWTATVTTGSVTLPNASGIGNLNETILNFPSGAVVTYQVTVAVPSSFTANLSNTGTVSTTTPDDDHSNDSGTTPGIPAAPSADIVTVKQLKDPAQSTFAPGQDVIYLITVTNNGPSDAKNVNINDVAPAGTTIGQWKATVTTGTVTLPNASGNGNLNETILNFPNGAVVTYEVPVKTPASFTGSLSNTANVTSGTPDPTPGNNNNTSSSSTSSPKADVSVVKTTASGTYVPGQSVVYQIVVSNAGPSDAKTVNVKDNAPAGTTISNWTATVTTGTVTLPNAAGNTNLNETIATLPAGAVVTYEVTVDIPSSFTADLTNTATASTTTQDDDQTNNTSTTGVIKPAAIADIVTVKQLKDPAQGTFAPGQDVVYLITVTNNGPSDAKNVNINDVAPAGTTIGQWKATVTTGTVTLPNASGNGNLNETILNFPNGAVVTYEVPVKTPASFTGSLSNTATVTSGTTDPTPGNNNNTSSSSTPSPKADVSVVKTTASGTYVPGQSVVYQIVVSNAGPSDAKNVNIKDNAPAGTTISNWTATVTTGTVTLPNAAGNTNLNETIATLPAGAVVTYEVTVDIPSSFTADLTNTATASTTTQDDDQTNNTSTTGVIKPAAIADIVTVKQLKDPAQSTFAPGEDVIYLITVTNNGPSDAKNVNVNDVAPTGTTIGQWKATVTTGIVTLPNATGNGNLNETILNFPNGAVVTYEVPVKTPASFTGSLSNTATVTSGTPDPTPGNNNNTSSSSTPSPKADVSVVKTTASGTYVPGQSVVYQIVVSNAGPSDANNVNIKDNAPAGTTISNWTATVTTGTVTLPNANGNTNLNETIATLPAGAVVTYEVTVDVPASFSADLINIATASTTTQDDDQTNNSSTTTAIKPSAKADVSVVKTTASGTYVPGQSVVYQIVVSNAGPSDAKTVNIKDNAPTGTTISKWTATVTTGTVTLPNAAGNTNLNETIATLPAGAVVMYEVTVDIPSSFTADLTNTATAGTTTQDDDQTNNTSTTGVIKPAAIADIVTVKQLKDPAQSTFAPGQDVIYLIKVTNNGPSDAKNVNIVDNAPAGTTIGQWKATVTTGTVTLPHANGNGNLNETIATFPNGAAVTYEVTVKTPGSFTGSLSNTATVTSGTTDPTPGNNNNISSSSTPSPKADVSVVKTTTFGAYVPGQNVIYQIVVSNAGPSDAKNVNIKDNAPAGTTINKWTAAVTTGTVTLPNAAGNTNLNETIATLPAGAVVTYDVTVAIPASFNADLSNTATATTTTPDDDQTNNTSTTGVIKPGAVADIVTVKQLKDASQTTFVPGQDVVYLIRVTNNGPSDAKIVNVKDDAPAGTTIAKWTATVTTGTVTLPKTSGTGNLNETIGTFPNGAAVTYEVTVQTPASFSGSLSNTATVTSGTTDPTPGNNNNTSSTTTPKPEADVAVVKQLKNLGQTTFSPGTAVVYSIRVINHGPSDAKNVNVKDNAPAGTTITKWTATVTNGTVTLPNASGTGNLNETIATLPDDAVVTYEVTVMTPADFTGTLSNSATVQSTTPETTPGNNTSTTPAITPAPSADIVTVKSLKNPAQTTFVAGKEVAYVITVTNNGPGDAADVNIKDIAPTGTTISSWTATVTNGTVILPKASGTGDLDETIAILPNAAVVTYEVVVLTPEGFTGNLVNVAAVTSTTPDPTTDCPACAAPPVKPEPSPAAAEDNQGNVRADNPVTIPVLNNDTPGDATTPLDPATVAVVQQPAHGSIVIREDGSIVYTPEKGYTGPDSFTYKVQDKNGNWSNVATVNLNIIPNEVDVPNVITPNGDGNNDKLVIKGLEKFVQNEIVIYNRWNNVLYRKQNYQGEWDGKGLNAGTYYYTLKGLDANGQWQTYNGYIMLLR